MLKEFTIATRSRTELKRVDDEVQRAIAESGVREGVCHLWVPHTTAAVTINENADPDVVRDILAETEKIVPFSNDYHHAEGNSAAHIKSSLFGPSLTLIVSGGRPVLGTWQSIFFCEFDGPRTRRLFVKVIEG
jgi:secondary thiamine-phosphate synthase enzyme